MTFAPILTTFSRSVVSDQRSTSSGKTRVRKKLARLYANCATTVRSFCGIARHASEAGRFQHLREGRKVEPTSLEEHAGLPAALFGAEQQQRAFGIVRRGVADPAGVRELDHAPPRVLSRRDGGVPCTSSRYGPSARRNTEPGTRPQ